MKTAEDFIILQGHVYQHNKKQNSLQTREIKKFPLFFKHTSYSIVCEKFRNTRGNVLLPISRITSEMVYFRSFCVLDVSRSSSRSVMQSQRKKITGVRSGLYGNHSEPQLANLVTEAYYAIIKDLEKSCMK